MKVIVNDMKIAAIATKPRSLRRNAVFAAVLAASLLAASCATSAPAAPELVVRERANQRWQALLAGDFEKSYNLLAPSYRAVTPLKRYRDGIGGGAVWTGAEVVSVKCNDAQDNCTAKVKISAKPLLGTRMGPQMTTHVDETWIAQDGQWWMVPNS